MGWFSKSEEKVNVPWVKLTSEEDLVHSLNQNEKAIFIFKHSTRCSISMIAKQRFEREWINPEQEVTVYYLDLLNYRSISNKIEELTGVEHQSPQLIVWKDGAVKYVCSHNGISAQRSLEALK